MFKHFGIICFPVSGTCCPDVLKQVELPVVPRSVCTANDHLGPQVLPTMFCAGYEAGGQDACQVSTLAPGSLLV